jgi:hypothetical protein
MVYVKTVWSDRVVEKPMTYTQVTNQDGTITLSPAEGAITAAGTPLTAANLNNMENGIANAVRRDGDAMTGPLTITQLNIAKTDGTLPQTLITYKPSVSAGGGVSFGAGGTTVIGAGEGGTNWLNNTQNVPDTQNENLFLVADSKAELWTNIQNIGTDLTAGKRFGFASNGDFQIGGDNTDQGAATGVISYTKSGKLYKMTHWTGSATQTDTTLQIGRIQPEMGLNWQPVTFVNNWVNTSGYTTKWAQDASGNILVNGLFQGGTNSAGSDIMHIPITPYTLLNPSTKIPIMRGDSALGWCEAVAVSTSYITIQTSTTSMVYSGWQAINAVIPLAAF